MLLFKLESISLLFGSVINGKFSVFFYGFFGVEILLLLLLLLSTTLPLRKALVNRFCINFLHYILA